jgi:hypothetical protein
MKLVQVMVMVSVLLPGLLAADFQVLHAGDSVPQPDLFVDMDGDGINDNASDKDGDGIPDKFAGENPVVPADTALVGGSAFQFDAPSVGIETGAIILETATADQNSKRFAALRMSVRSLCRLRGGIKSGDDFGAGSGMDNTSVKGVTCVGGVCH